MLLDRKDDSVRLLGSDSPDMTAILDRFERWDDARQKSGYPAKWYLSELLKSGYNQYYYNAADRRIEVHPKLSRFDEQWLNVIEPMCSLKASKISGLQNRFECSPLSASESEVEKAKASDSLLTHFQFDLNHREMLKKVCHLIRVYAIVYLHAYWNPLKRSNIAFFIGEPGTDTYVEILMARDGVEYKGEHSTQNGPVHVLEGPFGDVDSEIVLPYNIFIPPGAQSLEEAETFIRTSIRTINWVEDNFPDEAGKIDPQAISDTRTGSEFQDFMAYGDFDDPVDAINGTALSEEAGHVIVFENWERQPGGRWKRALCVESGVYDDESKEPLVLLALDDWDHHGYTQCPVPNDAHTAYPQSDVMRACGVQRQIDETFINMAVNQRISSKALLITGPGRHTTSKSEFAIIYKQSNPIGTAPPHLQNIPNNFQQQLQYMNTLVDSMKMMLNLHPIAFGQTQSVESGRGVMAMKEEQNTPLLDERESIDLAFEKFYEALLRIAFENYDSWRVVSLLNDSYDAHVISKTLLYRSPKVRVIASKILPMGITERWELASMMDERGMFLPESYERLHSFISFVTGGADELRAILPEPYRIKAACQAEHRAIEDGRCITVPGSVDEQGQPTEMILAYQSGEPVVTDIQDHAMELKEHRRFAMSDVVRRRWSAEMREQLAVLMANHQSLLNQAEQAATQGQIESERMREMAKAEAEIAIENAKVQGEIAVERVKGENELQAIAAKWEADTDRRLKEIQAKGEVQNEVSNADMVRNVATSEMTAAQTTKGQER